MKRIENLSNQLRDENLRLQNITIQIQEWWQTPRFQNCSRPYSAQQVSQVRGSIETEYFSNHMSRKFWDHINLCKANKTYSLAYGALDAIQVVNASKYLQSMYVSGWQCSSTSSSTNEPGPDFADYPYNTVPQKCDQLVRALRLQDRKQNFERAIMNDKQKIETLKIDYLTPLICDADTGFGGVTTTMKLIKLFIEAGAAGIHIEDQRAGTKKCGHMGGKVLVSAQEHCQRLIACRLQADILGSELVIIARTDALSAKLLDCNIDPVDHPYILGIVKGIKYPVTYPEAGCIAIDQQFQGGEIKEVKQLWLANCDKGGFQEACKYAQRLGFKLDFDWETTRNPDGYYQVRGCIEWCAARAKEYLKYADGLWMETDSPNLILAKKLTSLLNYEHDLLLQNKIFCYNLSPSFNWSNFDLKDEDLLNFSSKLAEDGFNWQFITLAGFHLNALQSEKLSKDLSERGMLAYVEKIQRKEVKHNVNQLRHQQWSGADYVDQIQMMINAKSQTLSQNEDSTELQFHQSKSDQTKR